MKLQRSTTGCKNYDIQVQGNFAENIKNYISVNNKEKHPLRIRENGQLINGIRNIQNNNSIVPNSNQAIIGRNDINVNSNHQIKILLERDEKQVSKKFLFNQNMQERKDDIEMKESSKIEKKYK